MALWGVLDPESPFLDYVTVQGRFTIPDFYIHVPNCIFVHHNKIVSKSGWICVD